MRIKTNFSIKKKVSFIISQTKKEKTEIFLDKIKKKNPLFTCGILHANCHI